MFTAKQLIDKAFTDNLGDDKRQSWDTTQMLEYLNDGWIELANRAKWFRTETQYDFLPNTNSTFTLPQNLIEIDFFVVQGFTTPIEVERLVSTNHADSQKILLLGTGAFYYRTKVREDAFLFYYAVPDALLITSSLTINDDMALGLIDYVCYRAYLKDQSSNAAEKAAVHLAGYNSKLNQFKDLAFRSLKKTPLKTSYQGF